TRAQPAPSKHGHGQYRSPPYPPRGTRPDRCEPGRRAARHVGAGLRQRAQPGHPPATDGSTWISAPSPTGVASPASRRHSSPSTYTLTYRRIAPCSSRIRRANCGQRAPISSSTPPRVPLDATVSFEAPPASAERYTPWWFWAKNWSGRPALRATLCTHWPNSGYWSSGRKYALMPVLLGAHVAPPSAVRYTPPVDIATSTES